MLFCGLGNLIRQGRLGQAVKFAGLADVPVLAKPAPKIATSRAKRQNGRARQKMVKRFFLDGINAKPAGATICGEHHSATLPGTHKTETPFALTQFAETRTHVTLHTPVIKPVPVSRGISTQLLIETEIDIRFHRLIIEQDEMQGQVEYQQKNGIMAVCMCASIRQPAVAGLFYSKNGDRLRREIRGYLEKACTCSALRPKGLIVPHAGYVYSGPVAASAYRLLLNRTEPVKHVVLLGPSHRVAFRGLALTESDYFLTPFGKIPVDHTQDETLAKLSPVRIWEAPHEREHSLEVQLPFLQEVLGEFSLIPIVVGQTGIEEVKSVIEKLWNGSDTLFVISSDLSHYLDYRGAQECDKKTARIIETLNPNGLHEDDACGHHPLRGFLAAAKSHQLSVTTLDLRNSGDTAGSKDQVVGYGAWSFMQSP